MASHDNNTRSLHGRSDERDTRRRRKKMRDVIGSFRCPPPGWSASIFLHSLPFYRPTHAARDFITQSGCRHHKLLWRFSRSASSRIFYEPNCEFQSLIAFHWPQNPISSFAYRQMRLNAYQRQIYIRHGLRHSTTASIKPWSKRISISILTPEEWKKSTLREVLEWEPSQVLVHGHDFRPTLFNQHNCSEIAVISHDIHY